MMNALAFVGVKQIRDTYDNPYTTAEFAQMSLQRGLKFDFFIALGSAWPEWQISQIKSNPSIVSYVEGFNESDAWWQTFHGESGVAATQAVQRYIYEAVKSDPVLADVGVVQATFIYPDSFTQYGDLSAYTDYASTHTYFGTGNNPSGSEDYIIAQSQTISPGKPTITTEAGYHTTLGNKHGVSQLVQAKYILDLLFEQAKLGVKVTYLWELADNYADAGNTNTEDHFGLFNNDWTPKVAAIALHNTMQIMADTGGPALMAGTLDYMFDGLPGSVQNSLYQKNDGTFVLVVWNDVRLSGPIVQGDLAVAPIPTALHLGQRFAHIAIFDPLTGVSSVQSFTDTDTIKLQVLDHPLIIQLSQDPNWVDPKSEIAAPDLITTNPLASVQVDGVMVTSQAPGTVQVRLQSSGNGLSLLDPAGHLLAIGANDVTLAGSLNDVNAELASLTYTGGTGTGSDLINISSVDAAGIISSRTIAVTIEDGTPAGNSGGPALSAPSTFAGIIDVPLVLPRVTLADAYAATHDGLLSLTISDTAGLLALPRFGGSVTGNGSTSLAAQGSFAQIVAALQGLSYTATGGSTQDTVVFQVTDQTGFSAGASTAVSIGSATGPIVSPITAAVSSAIVSPATPQVPTSSGNPSVPGIVAPDDGPPTPAAQVFSVFRFFDKISGTQFLTLSTAERDSVIASRPDLVAEGVGIGALMDPAADQNALAVYRFFDLNLGTHFYTSSSIERDALSTTRPDLVDEGVAFYEHGSPEAGDTAVYRFFDSTNGTHFYTASATERSSILATRADLVLEGVAFYTHMS